MAFLSQSPVLHLAYPHFDERVDTLGANGLVQVYLRCIPVIHAQGFAYRIFNYLQDVGQVALGGGGKKGRDGQCPPRPESF